MDGPEKPAAGGSWLACHFHKEVLPDPPSDARPLPLTASWAGFLYGTHSPVKATEPM